MTSANQKGEGKKPKSAWGRGTNGTTSIGMYEQYPGHFFNLNAIRSMTTLRVVIR
jgi:hypothetical protein